MASRLVDTIAAGRSALDQANAYLYTQGALPEVVPAPQGRDWAHQENPNELAKLRAEETLRTTFQERGWTRVHWPAGQERVYGEREYSDVSRSGYLSDDGTCLVLVPDGTSERGVRDQTAESVVRDQMGYLRDALVEARQLTVGSMPGRYTRQQTVPIDPAALEVVLFVPPGLTTVTDSTYRTPLERPRPWKHREGDQSITPTIVRTLPEFRALFGIDARNADQIQEARTNEATIGSFVSRCESRVSSLNENVRRANRNIGVASAAFLGVAIAATVWGQRAFELTRSLGTVPTIAAAAVIVAITAAAAVVASTLAHDRFQAVRVRADLRSKIEPLQQRKQAAVASIESLSFRSSVPTVPRRGR